MTINETARILAVIAAAYPRFQVDAEGLTLNIWYEMLGDLDYEIVQVAIKKLMLESPFPPAIADVRKIAAEITIPEEDRIDSADAWGEVVRAIRRYGYYDPDGAIQSMSNRTARVVQMIGWREICSCDEPSVVRGQFLRMYEQVSNREKKDALMPVELKEQIRMIGNIHRLRELAAGSEGVNIYKLLGGE